MSRGGGALLLLSGFIVCILLMSIGDQKSRQAHAEPSSASGKAEAPNVFPDDRYRRLTHFVQVRRRPLTSPHRFPRIDGASVDFPLSNVAGRLTYLEIPGHGRSCEHVQRS